MLSPFWYSRAPLSSSLLRSFQNSTHCASRSTTLSVFVALRAPKIKIQTHTQRFIHITPRTQLSFRPSRILQWREEGKRMNVKVKEMEKEKEVHSFRETVALEAQKQEGFATKVGKPGIWRQIIFFGCASVVIFLTMYGATLASTIFWLRMYELNGTEEELTGITSEDMEGFRLQHTYEFLKNCRDSMLEWPHPLDGLLLPPFYAIFDPYLQMAEGKRLMLKLCLLNVVVWMLWKMPNLRVQRMMNSAFKHDPLSGKSYTLLTSVFSHKNIFHLLLTSFALEGFGDTAFYYLNLKQKATEPPMLEATTIFHFLSFYTIAGMFSVLFAHIVATKFRYTRTIRLNVMRAATRPRIETWREALASKAHPTSFLFSSFGKKGKKGKYEPGFSPTIGAGGALYACIVMTALAVPDGQLSLFLPPADSINLRTGVGALLLWDIIGVLRGWSRFNHWAHLGGALFGGLYYLIGPALWDWQKRSDPETVEELLVSQTFIDEE